MPRLAQSALSFLYQCLFPLRDAIMGMRGIAGAVTRAPPCLERGQTACQIGRFRSVRFFLPETDGWTASMSKINLPRGPQNGTRLFPLITQNYGKLSGGHCKRLNGNKGTCHIRWSTFSCGMCVLFWPINHCNYTRSRILSSCSNSSITLHETWKFQDRRLSFLFLCSLCIQNTREQQRSLYLEKTS